MSDGLRENATQLLYKLTEYLNNHPARMEDEHLWLLSESREMLRRLVNRHE